MCNGFWLGLVLLTVHLVVCGGLWLLARARTLEVEGYFVPVMLLVPLWGPLCVLLLHTSNRLTGECSREQMLEKLRINEEIHKSIPEAKYEETAHISKKSTETVPLIRQRTAGIIQHIIFYVVHTHVMSKICFRCMTKEGANKPDHIMI